MSDLRVNPFKVGDTVIGIFTRRMYKVTGVSGELIQLNGCSEWVTSFAFTLIRKTETYTPEQLSEIDELHARVDMLESLCSDYVKIIEGKDAEILRLNNAASDFWCDYR